MGYYEDEGRRFLFDLWREKVDKPPVLKERGFMEKAPVQWSEKFEKLVVSTLPEFEFEFSMLKPHMKNRLAIGACRYGLLNDPFKPRWDRIGRLKYEIEKYVEDSNSEHLVDAMNMALLECEEADNFMETTIVLILKWVYSDRFDLNPIFNNKKVKEY